MKALLITLVLYVGSAFAAGSTANSYTISGSSPYLLLEDSDLTGHDWFINNDCISSSFIPPENSFTIVDSYCVGGGGICILESTTPMIIEPTSPTNLLYLDSNGHIGINTSIPQQELDVRSNNPAVRLKDNSAGAGMADLEMDGHEFSIRGESYQRAMRIDTRAPSDSFSIDQNGHVGFGTSNPNANLHLTGGSSDATFLFETTGKGWYMLNKNASGRFNITDDPTFARVPFKIGAGAQQNLMKIGCGVTNQVYINGNLVVAGTITPDYVFEDRYTLKSIEEHADFMWENKHLPAVEKAKVDQDGKGVVDLGKRSQELLEELETAHIYIQQLNEEIRELKTLNSNMKEKFKNKMEAFEKRLSEIES